MSNHLNRACVLGVLVIGLAFTACTPSLDDLGLHPSVVAQQVSTDEDVPITIDALKFAIGFNTTSLTVSGVSAPGGHATQLQGRNILVTPKPDFSGTFTVTWLVSGGGDQATGYATVTVRAVDDLIATGGSQTIQGPTTIILGATGGDVTHPLTYQILSGPSFGTISGTPPMLLYQPEPGFTGDDQITYQVSNLLATSAPGTLHLYVHGNPLATAIDTQYSGLEDQALGLVLSASGGDHPLTFTIETPPAHGTLSGTAPNLTYTPAANFNGFDSLRFSVSDGTVTSNVATVAIQIQGTNDAPIAVAQSVTVTEDTQRIITLVGSDIDNDTLTYTARPPTHGTLSGFGPSLTYTPAPNYHGPDSFTFTVTDFTFVPSMPATVTINVTSVEDSPVAAPLVVSLNEDSSAAITLVGSDGDGDAVSFGNATQPAHGTVTGTPPLVTYVPSANYNGSDAFTYTVSSGGTTSAPATVNLTVRAVNDAPVATNSEVSTPEDTAIAITLQATDIDNDSSSLSYTILTVPSDGGLPSTGTSAIRTYTPAPNATGTRSFLFQVSDPSGATATATVTIHITPVNDAPIARDDYVATAPGTPITINVTGNDFDVDAGDTVAIASFDEASAHGSVALVDGKLVYTPDEGFTDVDVFGYTIVDPQGASATAQVHVGVGAFPPGAPLELLATVGGPVDTSTQRAPALSFDGRYVAFSTSLALVSDDTNGAVDVYVYDRSTRTVTRASVATGGGQGNGTSARPQLSADGRYVVFDSTATNLVGNDTNGKLDVFRHDQLTGETVRISVATGGGQGSGDSADARVSDDGNIIAFTSGAFELIDSDTNGVFDIFVRDVAAGATSLISASVSGHEASDASQQPALSGDGRYVAFASSAINLVDGDSNQVRDVFVRDRVTSTTTRVSVSSIGVQADAASFQPSISRDGRYVSFLSGASTLVSPTSSSLTRVYVRDRTAQITTRPVTTVSPLLARLSGDGRYITVFTGLSASPTSITDRFTATTVTPPGSASWFWPVLSGNSRYIAFLDPSNTGGLVVAPNPMIAAP